MEKIGIFKAVTVRSTKKDFVMNFGLFQGLIRCRIRKGDDVQVFTTTLDTNLTLFIKNCLAFYGLTIDDLSTKQLEAYALGVTELMLHINSYNKEINLYNKQL